MIKTALFRLGNVCFLVCWILTLVGSWSDRWVRYPPGGHAGLWVQCGEPIFANSTSIITNSNTTALPGGGWITSRPTQFQTTTRKSAFGVSSTTISTPGVNASKYDATCLNLDILELDVYLHFTRGFIIIGFIFLVFPLLNCRMLKIDNVEDGDSFCERLGVTISIGLGEACHRIAIWIYSDNACSVGNYGEDATISTAIDVMNAALYLAIISAVLMLSPLVFKRIGHKLPDCDGISERCRNMDNRVGAGFRLLLSRIRHPGRSGQETNTPASDSRNRRSSLIEPRFSNRDVDTLSIASEGDLGVTRIAVNGNRGRSETSLHRSRSVSSDSLHSGDVGTGTRPDLRGFVATTSDPAPAYEDLPPRAEPPGTPPPPSYDEFLRGSYAMTENQSTAPPMTLPPSAPVQRVSSNSSIDSVDAASFSSVSVTNSEPPAAPGFEPLPPPLNSQDGTSLGPPPAYEDSVV